jgi:hypothetical protein
LDAAGARGEGAQGGAPEAGLQRRRGACPRLPCNPLKKGEGSGNQARKFQKQEQDPQSHERARSALKSGSGKKVKSRKQAVAFALSEAPKSDARIPKKKKS